MLMKLLKVQYLSAHLDKHYYNLCLKTLDYIEENKLPYQLKDLAIDGNDIQKYGYQNQEISKQLNKILSLVIKNKLNNTREDLYEYLTLQSKSNK